MLQDAGDADAAVLLLCRLFFRSHSGENSESVRLAVASFLTSTLGKVDASADAKLATDFVGFLCLATTQQRQTRLGHVISLMGDDEDAASSSSSFLANLMAVFRKCGSPLELRLACLGTAENLMTGMDKKGGGIGDDRALEMVRDLFSLVDRVLYDREDVGDCCCWSDTTEPLRTVRAVLKPWCRDQTRLDFSRGGSVGLSPSAAGAASLAAHNRPTSARLSESFQEGTLSWKVELSAEPSGGFRRGRGASGFVGLGMARVDRGDSASSSGGGSGGGPVQRSWLARGNELTRLGVAAWPPLQAVPAFERRGDALSFVADLDAGTLSVRKNHGCGGRGDDDDGEEEEEGGATLLFDDLPADVPLSPVVVFYPGDAGARLRVTDVSHRPRNSRGVGGGWSKAPGVVDPSVPPAGEAAAQAVVRCLRRLYQRSRVWKDAIDRHLGEVLGSESNLALLRRTDLAALLKDEEEGKKAAEAVELFTSRVLPALAFVGGIDAGLYVGCRVRKGRKTGWRRGDVGVVTGGRVQGGGAAIYDVMWEKDGETSSGVEGGDLVLAEEEESFSFDFGVLLCVEKVQLLSLSSGFCAGSPLRMRRRDVSRLVERHLVRSTGRKRSPAAKAGGRASPERQKSVTFRKAAPPTRLERRDKRSSSLPDGRSLQDAATSASVERLTNILVSSIIDEVTGKTPPSLPRATSSSARTSSSGKSRSRGAAAGSSEAMGCISEEAEAKSSSVWLSESVLEAKKQKKKKTEKEDKSEKGGVPTKEFTVLATLVRAAAVRTAAEKTLLALLDSPACDQHLEEDPGGGGGGGGAAAEQSGVAAQLREVVKSCWEACTTSSASAMPLAAPVSIRDVERAMGIIR